MKTTTNRKISGLKGTGLLTGKVVVVTGVLNGWFLNRHEAKAAIEAAGGKSPSSLPVSAYALVVGDKAGPSKLNKAAERNIPILDEDGFRELLATGTL